jgi:hypothetical protein
MSLLGNRVLLICHDFPFDDVRDFHEWYIREHMPERVLLPGYNRGRRFQSDGLGPKFLAFYEATDASALSSDAYLKLVRDFDARSRTFVTRFRSTSRTVSVVTKSCGRGEGGWVALLGFSAAAEKEGPLRGKVGDDLVEGLVKTPGVVAAHLLEADKTALAHSKEGHIRQGDLELPWTLLIETINTDILRSLWPTHLSDPTLASLGVTNVLQRGVYQFLFGMSANTALK